MSTITVTDMDPDIKVEIVLSGSKTNLQSEFDTREASSDLATAKAWLAGQILNLARDALDNGMTGNDQTDAEIDADIAVLTAIKTNRVTVPDIGTP